MHVAQLKRQVKGLTSLNINFPITILTYNISLQQTGKWLSHPKSNCLRI
jgi:hypothetical protein